MSTKEWLNRGWKIEQEIAALEREQKKAQDRLYQLSPSYDGVKVQTAGGNKQEDALLSCIEYTKLIEIHKAKLDEVKCEIIKAIYSVDNSTYRTLLIMRYLSFMTWERIAEEMHMDLRNVYRVHERAVDVVEIHAQLKICK